MKRGILSHCLRIFLICWAIVSFYVAFMEVMPVTRRYFLSYHSFDERVDFSVYPNELLESAHDIKYYFYEGFFADKSGYRVAYSQEDYKLMKESRWDFYAGLADTEGKYCYDGGTKQYLDWKQMQAWKIDFLDQLLLDKEDDGNYYILAYLMCETQEIYLYHCVLCNDEACEMIEISYHGPN
ncbi:MAG: hypothetical protein K2H41_00545 [Acetatifactor sp.]|nr:hypothetical protein [Acetatifactor sp.]